MITSDSDPRDLDAGAALARLRAGNQRFVEGVRSVESLTARARLADLVGAQQPFAIVLGCSDSRAPAEILFDQGLGDLFVIRVAGNVVAPSQVGSVEFAAERFGVRLVVVMGHTHCGAIDATVNALTNGTQASSSGQSSILDRVKPSVEPLLGTDLARDPDALMRAAVRANAVRAADHLRHGSTVLERLAAEAGLRVVASVFELDTGEVRFLEGVK